MTHPGPDPDDYPPIDPTEPVPDDPGPLSPDTPEALPPAPVEPKPGPDDPDSVPVSSRRLSLASPETQPRGVGAIRRTSLPMGLSREVPSSGLCRLVEGAGEAVPAAVCALPRAQRRS